MTHRPATMDFGPGLHVFPGGAVDPDDRDPALVARCTLDPAGCAAAWNMDLPAAEAMAHALAAVRELYEEAGVLLADRGNGSPVPAATVSDALRAGEAFSHLVLRLSLVIRTDLLVPLSRWVTPPGSGPRRYDTRFFAADLPRGAVPRADEREVSAHEWLAPRAALAAAGDGRITLWPPTSTTLRQLLRASGLEDLRTHLAPRRPAIEPRAERVAPGITRVRTDGAGGIPGNAVTTWLLGRRRVLAVDPGDPNEAAMAAILDAVAAAGAVLAGVVLTSPVPDHAGGALILAAMAGVDVLVAGAAERAGAAALVGGPVRALADGETLDSVDVTVVALDTPGTDPGHLALVAPTLGALVVGDLDGPRPERGIPEPVDASALAVSRARIHDAVRLVGRGGRPVLRLSAHG